MPLDIVIFGVIAVVLIFRLLGVMGQNDKDDGRPRKDALGAYRKHKLKEKALREAQREAQRETRSQDSQSADKTISIKSKPKLDASTRDRAPDAKTPATARDDDFNTKVFLKGASAAFAMILEAYSKGDKGRLKALLDDEVMARFEENIDRREKNQQRLEIALYDISTTEIVSRESKNNNHQLVVKFVSKQCHLLFDSDNKLIEGDPETDETITELWTFRQPLRTQDPTWRLCAIEAAPERSTRQSSKRTSTSTGNKGKDSKSKKSKPKSPKARGATTS